MTKSILIVGNINHFSPRISSYCLHWVSQGYAVTIISPVAGGKAKGVDEKLKQAGVDFYSLGKTRSLLQIFKSVYLLLKNSFKVVIVHDQEPSAEHLTHRRFVIKVLKSICFPDEELEYLIKSLWAVSRIELRSYDLVLSSSPYFSSHIVGWFAKYRHPSIRWIADYRDTFSTNPTYNVFNWRRTIDCYFERSIIKSTSAISTVSENYKKQLQFVGANACPEISVIPSGYQEDFYNRRARKQNFQGDLVIIRYFGQYFDEYYPTKFIVKCLSDINSHLGDLKMRLRFEAYGPMNTAMSVSASKGAFEFSVNGYIPRTDAVELQRRSSANILFSSGLGTNFGLSHLKLYEYLDAGRPVLAIVDGASQEIQWVARTRKNFFLLDAGSEAEKNSEEIRRLINRLCTMNSADHNLYVRPMISRSSKVLSKKFSDEMF